MRFQRATTRLIVAAVVILTGMVLLVPPLSRTAAFRDLAQNTLYSTTGYDVTLSTIAIGYDFSAAATDVSVSAPGQPPFLVAPRIAIGLSLRPLFSGRVAIVRVEEPHLFVARIPAPPGDGGPVSLPFSILEIVDGFAHFEATQGKVAVGPLSLSVDSLSAGPMFALRGRSEMNLPKLARRLKIPGVPEGIAEASVDVSGTPPELQGSGWVRVRGFRWQHGDTTLSGDLDVPFELRDTTLTFGVRGRRIGQLAGSVSGLAWQVKQVEVSGKIEGDDGSLRGTADIVLADGNFRDAGGLRAGDSLRIAGRLELVRKPSVPLKVRVDLYLPKGEILWGRFYANLKDNPATVRGELQPGSDAVVISDLALGADGIGSITLSGNLRTDMARGALRARLDLDGLDRLYALAARDVWQETYPLLARTSAAGALTGNIEYRQGDPDWSLSGRIRLSNGRVLASDPLVDLRGLSVDLPIALGTARLDATAQRGSVRVATLELGGVSIPETAAKLDVMPNAVRLAESVSVPVLGGAFVLNELEGLQLAGSNWQANLGFALRDLDLERLSRALGWPLLRGTIAGAVPEVTVTNGEIRSQGEIGVQAFGGEIRARNLQVTQLFSSVPTLSLDVDFENILLGRLTETLEIGHISGVARGAVHDLAIVNGQPLRFKAWVETVPRPDVSQRISVTAIRQVSMLGGAGGDPLSQRVLSFFDEYRYAKMGFRCSLENDRFLLRGVEQLEGKDYLVVGSFMPPRVNVISRNQVISFSEMVRRLERVTSEPTEEPERNQ